MNSARDGGMELVVKSQTDVPAIDDVSHVTEIAGRHTNRHADWCEPPALTLNAQGVIVDCSDRGESFFGYARTELARLHISSILPQLAGLDLLQNGEPNPYFAFLCHIGHAFEVKPREGAAFLCSWSLVCFRNAGQTILRLIAQPSPAAFA
jgi:PAS domain-containing protein